MQLRGQMDHTHTNTHMQLTVQIDRSQSRFFWCTLLVYIVVRHTLYHL